VSPSLSVVNRKKITAHYNN